MLDVHIFRAHEIGAVAALGGTTVGSHLFEQLSDLGIERVVIALDNDPAGHDATARTVDASVRASRSPQSWIIDPDLLDTAKDPGELIHRLGADAWQRTAAAPTCGVAWRALDLTGPAIATGDELARRAALARAGAWLGQLLARLVVEQTTALDLVANTFGYDTTVIQRAFRARYWSRDPTPNAHTSRASGITR